MTIKQIFLRPLSSRTSLKIWAVVLVFNLVGCACGVATDCALGAAGNGLIAGVAFAAVLCCIERSMNTSEYQKEYQKGMQNIAWHDEPQPAFYPGEQVILKNRQPQIMVVESNTPLEQSVVIWFTDGLLKRETVAWSCLKRPSFWHRFWN